MVEITLKVSFIIWTAKSITKFYYKVGRLLCFVHCCLLLNTVILFRYYLTIFFLMLLLIHAGMWLSLFSININHISLSSSFTVCKNVTNVCLTKLHFWTWSQLIYFNLRSSQTTRGSEVHNEKADNRTDKC